MLYLCPRKRYAYWTPKGLRKDDKVQKHHKGAGGNRTSPFISFWFVDLAPALPSRQLQQWWTERGGLRAWAAGNSTTTNYISSSHVWHFIVRFNSRFRYGQLYYVILRLSSD